MTAAADIHPSSTSRPPVVVIGAGLGGIAAAIRLQARGYQVSLIDQLDKPGGRAYVFEEEGYTFDAGPTVVTIPLLFEELFELAGQRLEDHVRLVRLDPYYRVRFFDGHTFDYSDEAAAIEAQIARLNPGDVEGFRRYFEDTREIYRVGFDGLADKPFHELWDMLKVAPELVRLRSYLNVSQMVARYVEDPRLRIALSLHPLLVGGNPFTTTSIYSMILYLERAHGVWYAMGGTGAIVRALVRLFTELGGVVRLSTRAEEILLDRRGGQPRARGVRLAGGEILDARYVVSNADVATTYARLIPEGARRRYTDARLARMRYSNGLFVAYFGTDRRYPDVLHHTILLGPRFKEHLSDIFHRKILADDFSLYLHRPTATDPSMAPPGCDCFYVLAPVPHLGAEEPVDWEAEGPRYCQRIHDHLEATVLPGLSAHLKVSRFVTPAYFEGSLSSYLGAGFSVQPDLLQSAWFRPHNRSEDVDGLFFVGAGTHPGAGMPGVLCTAKVVDRLIPRLGGAPPGAPIAGTHARG